MTMTRGEFNRNPLNINIMKPSVAWNGQLGVEIVQPGHHYTPRFGRYDTDFHGIRAGAKQIVKDNTVHGLTTLRDLIGDKTYGWAPAADKNDVPAYCATVLEHLRANGLPAFTIDTVFNIAAGDAVRLLPVLWTGFCLEENGRCNYASDLILSACRDALGLPKE